VSVFYSRNARRAYAKPGSSIVIAASRVVNRGNASPIPAEGDVKDKLSRVGERRRKKKKTRKRTNLLGCEVRRNITSG